MIRLEERKLSLQMKSAVCAALCAASFVVSAKTVYVDVTRPDDTGDGLSWETAKHTIQGAVNATADGDTVLVRPGVYDGGFGHPESAPESNYKSRVYINHGITLKSTDGAEATHIVGARDPDTLTTAGMLGNGPNAVRCIFVNHTWQMTTVVEGFTIRDGAAHQQTASDGDNGLANGGGLRTSNGDTAAYLVDCIVENCTGRRGGAMRNGTAIRTRFRRNTTTSKGGVGCYSKFLFCVMSGNESPGGGLVVGGTVVNCTIANNIHHGNVFTENTLVYNSLIVQNEGAVSSGMIGEKYYHSIAAHMYDGYLTRYRQCERDEACHDGLDIVYFHAPFIGDYRLVPGTAAFDRASGDYLTVIKVPDGYIANKTIEGVEFDASKPFPVGAIQTVVEPKGGLVHFTSGKLSIDGVPAEGMPNYLFAETYPTQFLVRPLADQKPLFGYYYRCSSGNRWRFPQPDDSFWFMPPAKNRGVTNDISFVTNEYYVDPAAAAGGDGTTAKPFRTIQKAVDTVPAGDAYRNMIHVAAGTYDSEEDLRGDVQGHTNRVSIWGSRYIRMVGAGEGQTIIKGKADPNGPEGDGRGPAAIRCFASQSGVVAVQNMTLTEGYVGYPGENGSQDVAAGRGGAVCAHSNNDMQVLDCTISDSVGYRGAIYSGTFTRCRITNSGGYGGGMRYSKLICCVVDNMRSLSGGLPVANGSWLTQCTIVGRDTDEVIYTEDIYTNVVVHTTKWIGGRMKMPGSIVWNFQGGIPSTSDAKLGDPQFTRGDGDYMPLATSPVVGAGILFDAYEDNYYSPDRNCNPICFVDGKPCAGAYQTFRSGYSIELPANSYGVQTTPAAGYAEVEPGETVTIAVDLSGAQRPCTQVEVNGVVTNSTRVTFTAPSAGEPSAGIKVVPVISPHWYVDAVNGDNANNGFTPETAKRTFKGLESDYVMSGDTIHAAAGRYDDEVMEVFKQGTTEPTVKARLFMKAGLTVIGAGAGKSFIVGADAPAGNADAYGRGVGAVRCVYMMANGADTTLLKGFTVCGGRVDGADNNYNNNGGGIHSYGGRNGVIIDCDIVDCGAGRGGGLQGGVAIGCRFFRNRARYNRSAASESYLYNCVFDDNYGNNTIQNCYDTIGCTFGPNCWNEDGTASVDAIGLPIKSVVNCLVLGTYNATDQNPLYATNCVFLTANRKNPIDHRYVYDANTVFVDEAQVTDAFEPVIGHNVAIDKAIDVDYAACEGLAYVRSNPLVQEALARRYYNGQADIGAVEADWRATYAAAMGKNVTVTNATPNVTLVDGKIRIPDGESIEGTWGREKEGHMFTYTYAAQAVDGTLTGAIGDQDVVVTGSPEPVTFKTSAAAYPFAFSFVGTGYGSLSGWSIKDSSATLILFR